MHLDLRNDLEIHGVTDQASMDIWREELNWVRPHESLAMKYPGNVYLKSDRVYTAEELESVTGFDPYLRCVNKNGQIGYGKKSYYVASGLAGLPVRLKRRNSHRIAVEFEYLLMGEIDEQEQHFYAYSEL